MNRCARGMSQTSVLPLCSLPSTSRKLYTPNPLARLISTLRSGRQSAPSPIRLSDVDVFANVQSCSTRVDPSN